MRKRRGVLLMLVGIVLAGLAGVMILNVARRAAEAPKVVQAEPIKKVYVLVAQNDLPENVAVSAEDVALNEFPADFAPAGAVAGPEFAVGKFTTSKMYKGQIIVAPLLSDTRKAGQFSSRIQEGKVAMAVTVNDALNSLGALRAGDRVDILLTVDLAKGVAKKNTTSGQTAGQPAQAQTGATSADQLPEQNLSTQLTMQSVEILAIGVPAGEPGTNGQATAPAQGNGSQQADKTITFQLDPQDAVTLKFIKDSGGVMDLVVRAPNDTKVAKTDAVTLDSIYQKFRFRFPEPLK